MWPFKQIKDWFCFPEKKNSVAEIILYLPVGDLPSLWAYEDKFLPYKADLDKDGKYDKLKEFQGADLTILQGGGDCEDLAAFRSEIIRHWYGWESWHICFVFVVNGEYKGHDVDFFKRPDGSMGWNDGITYEGGYDAFVKQNKAVGWEIWDFWMVNDMGEHIN